MASARKLPSGKWQGRFRYGGKQHTMAFDYEFEARQWAEDGEARAARLTEADPMPASVQPVTPPTVTTETVADYGKRWLARMHGVNEAATVSWYGTQLRVGIAPTALGRMPIGAVKRGDVLAWLSAQHGVGAATRKARLKTLRAIMGAAIIDDLIVKDPTFKVKMPTVETRPPAKANPDLLTALLAEADDDVRLIMLLTLDAGLRWGEAAGMTVEAVWLDGEPRLWVGQVVTRDRKVRGYTKSHRARWVPITTERLAEALRERMAKVGSGLLVSAADGRPVSYWACRDGFDKARAAVGIPEAVGGRTVGFHALRHMFGTTLGNASVPRRDIATMLGHADESTTATYLHGNDQAAMFAAARAAKAVAG